MTSDDGMTYYYPMIVFAIISDHLWVGLCGRAFCTGQTTLGL